MGTVKSQPAGLVIEPKAFSSDNYWTLHSATFGSGLLNKVTVFIQVSNANSKSGALEKFAKNLMIYRHPNILRFIASWKVHDQYHLATEEIQTLSQAISRQTPLQICIGLNCILKALNFLHEKATSSHNNVCQAAVYVTQEGYWKLGGMEHLCRFSDLSTRFLAESRDERYENAILPDEDDFIPQPPSIIDIYAFCVLVNEVLGKLVGDEVPSLLDFVRLCREFIDVKESRSKFSLTSFINHNFFNHEFISIHNFLTELPLKSETEKQIFFSELSGKLRGFNETIVASQLGSLLLSRMVLLDSTAQQCLLPFIFNVCPDYNKDCIFSKDTFRKLIVPKLLSIFCVRDIQVRLTLLKYFSSYCGMFSMTELQARVLPELLVGIKDTNNDLVEATLRALADLVPVLGASKVIGGVRAKHFSDGRPKIIKKTKGKEVTPKLNVIESKSEHEGKEVGIFLPERPSPDGGEAVGTALDPPTTEDEDCAWDSWDPVGPVEELCSQADKVIMEKAPAISVIESIPLNSSHTESVTVKPVTTVDTLDVYEVKAQEIRKPSVCEEVDYFQDMEPVISKARILEISSQKCVPTNKDSKNKSKFDIDLEAEPEGWGDELEWAEVNCE